MANGSIRDIWENTDLKNQPEVNKAMRDTMFIVSPAVERVWLLNIKVNVLYAVITFSVVVTGIVLGILQLTRKG